MKKQKKIEEVIGICRGPNTNNGYENYHIVRCQKQGYDARVKEKYEKYNARPLFRIDTNNSAHCWHSIRNYLDKQNGYDTKGYSFRYQGTIEENRLQKVLHDSIKAIKNQVSRK